MADDRKFFAGDLGTQHLQHDITVETRTPVVSGRLIGVQHLPVDGGSASTVVTLAEGIETSPWVTSPTYVLGEHDVVVVR
jgi:hypothetical protein